MNLVLLLLLIAEVCLGICIRLSPAYLRRLAAHLLTRADMIDLVEKQRERRMRYWTLELGAMATPQEDPIEGLDRNRLLVRH